MEKRANESCCPTLSFDVGVKREWTGGSQIGIKWWMMGGAGESINYREINVNKNLKLRKDNLYNYLAGQVLGEIFGNVYAKNFIVTIDKSSRKLAAAQLRHASVATTQKSYFAMERGVAGKQLRDAWKEHPIASSIKHEKAVIDANRNLPGYG